MNQNQWTDEVQKAKQRIVEQTKHLDKPTTVREQCCNRCNHSGRCQDKQDNEISQCTIILDSR
jgi:hypothetical protein